MKKKAAIVMDVKDGYAVLLKCGDFVKVKDKGYKKGQTVAMPGISVKPLIAMAACLVLMFSACFSGYAVYRTPSDYIYMDINPSLRLDINRFGRVISVVPLNSDAEELMASYVFDSSDPELCMEQIVSACREKSYINDENKDVEIDVAGEKKSLIKKAGSVSERLSEGNVTVSVKKITTDENEKAINYKSSPKRLAAIEDYTKVFGGTLEDNVGALAGVSVKDIREMIKAAESEKAEGTKKAPEEEKRSEVKAPQNEEPAPESNEVPDENVPETSEEHEKGKKGTGQKSDTPSLKPSGKRLAAIEEYTKVFGGTVEDNTLLLRDRSVKEIREMIKEAQAPSEKESD